MQRDISTRASPVEVAALLPPAGGWGLVVASLQGFVQRGHGVAASGGPKGMQLGRHQLAVRSDERFAVILHGLVPGVRVLRQDGVDGVDQDQDEEDEDERRVEDEEHDSHHPGDEAGLVEHVGEEEKEDGVDEVERGDRDVVDVGLLVHPWPAYTDGDQHACLDDQQRYRLHHGCILAQADEDGPEDRVDQRGDDEIVGRGFIVHVEEAPTTEERSVRVKQICWIAMNGQRLSRKRDDPERCKPDAGNHPKQHDDCEQNLCWRIMLSELPQAENEHLRKPDQDQSKHDTLCNEIPSSSQRSECILPARSSSNIAGGLEHGDKKHHQGHKDDEEYQSGQEDIAHFDPSPKSHSLDSSNDDSAPISIPLWSRSSNQFRRMLKNLRGALHHMHRCHRQIRQNLRRTPPS